MRVQSITFSVAKKKKKKKNETFLGPRQPPTLRPRKCDAPRENAGKAALSIWYLRMCYFREYKKKIFEKLSYVIFRVILNYKSCFVNLMDLYNQDEKSRVFEKIVFKRSSSHGLITGKNFFVNETILEINSTERENRRVR